MEDIMSWLVSSEPWTAYRARLDLLGQHETDPEVKLARKELLAHPRTVDLVTELQNWPGQILNNHKSAGHPIHKLTFLADLGLRADDSGIDEVIKRILKHQSRQGPFQVLINIHPRYGGTGEDGWAWALCDAPLLIYALAKFGLADEPRVCKATKYLAGLVRENGWPCAVSPELGTFRGPGRKDDPCPYANLVMLKALAQIEELQECDATRKGAKAALILWEERRERHPYMFYMGTDFSKMKAPLVWYDLLHVVDVLTQFGWLIDDPRLQQMIDLVKSKEDEAGRYTPESIWTAWKGWDFGQKKEPSPWLTFLARRALARVM